MPVPGRRAQDELAKKAYGKCLITVRHKNTGGSKCFMA